MRAIKVEFRENSSFYNALLIRDKRKERNTIQSFSNKTREEEENRNEEIIKMRRDEHRER